MSDRLPRKHVFIRTDCAVPTRQHALDHSNQFIISNFYSLNYDIMKRNPQSVGGVKPLVRTILQCGTDRDDEHTDTVHYTDRCIE